MRKFFTTFLLIAIIAGVMFAPFDFQLKQKVALAQNPGNNSVYNSTNAGGPCSGIVDGLKCAVADIIYLPLVFTSWILWIAGVLLNKVLEFTVINLAVKINGISGIGIAWGVIRDLANMLFIFVLLYGAIQTILGIGGRKVKEIVVGVVIAAILINFSMLFTKLIIDASNIVAVTFYERLSPTGDGTGLANSYMAPLKLQTLFSSTGGASPGSGSTALEKVAGGNLGTLGIVSIGGSIFLIITSFVFLAVSLMFLIRFVNFIFLLVLSPIGLIGSVIPGIKKYSSKWWDRLISESLFAPVYMILSWVVVTIISSPGFVGVVTNGDGATGGTASAVFSSAFNGVSNGTAGIGAFSLIMNFVIIIAFAIGTLIISKELANQSGGAGQKIIGSVMGAGAGVAGFAGRKIVGGQARKMADDKDLKDRAASGDTGARLQLMAAQKLAGASFDVRSNKALGFVGGVVGYDIGKEVGAGKAGGKGGYDAVIKRRAEAKEKFSKSLGPTDIEKDEANQRLIRAQADLENAERDGDSEKIESARKAKDLAQQEVENLSGIKKDEKTRKVNELNNQKDGAVKKLETERDAEVNKDSAIAAAKRAQELKDIIDKKRLELDNNLIPELNDNIQNELKEAEQELENLWTDTGRPKEELGENGSISEALQKIADLRAKEINSAYQAQIDNIESSTKEQVDAIKNFKSVGDVRKERYAESISTAATYNIPGIGRVRAPSFNRVGFIGPISRANKQAAAALRGQGGKSESEKIAEAARKMAEEQIKSESADATEGAEGGATASPGREPTAPAGGEKGAPASK